MIEECISQILAKSGWLQTFFFFEIMNWQTEVLAAFFSCPLVSFIKNRLPCKFSVLIYLSISRVIENWGIENSTYSKDSNTLRMLRVALKNRKLVIFSNDFVNVFHSCSNSMPWPNYTVNDLLNLTYNLGNFVWS